MPTGNGTTAHQSVQGSKRTGVYQIKNLVNGKRYVGSASKSLSDRGEYHFWQLRTDSHYNKHLQNAWNKYGEESFVFEEIEYCSPEMCVPREQCWIDYYQSASRSFGYNLSPTAGSCLGVKRTEEQKAELKRRRNCPEYRKQRSEIQKKLWADPEHREKHLRAVRNPEYRKRLSEIQEELWNDIAKREQHGELVKQSLARPEIKIKMIEGMLKRWSNPELRRIQSENMRVSHSKPEVKKRISNGTKAGQTAEVKAKISDGLRRRWSNPEARKKQSESCKKACSSPEIRKKRSEYSTKNWIDKKVRKRRIDGIKSVIENRSQKEKERWAGAIKAAKSTPEAKARISAKMKETHANPKVKAKISAAAKKAWSDMDRRKRMGAKCSRILSTPEMRAKISKATREGIALRKARLLADR